jgi:hypothetical protein
VRGRCGGIDVAADRCAHRQEEGQRGQATGIAGDVEVAIQEDAAEPAEIAKFQIHHQKREIVKHVDFGEGGVELDGIEQHGPTLVRDDVAQVQIAVAMADKSFGATAIEQRRQRRQRLARRRSKLARPGRIEEHRIDIGEAAHVAVENVRHRGSASRLWPPFGVGVKAGDAVGEALHGESVKAAGLRQPVE